MTQMRKKSAVTIIAAAILFLIPLSAFSQYEGKARMRGVVKDGQGNPVADVTVKLFSFRAHAGFETRTDENGTWKAMWVRSGRWNIDFDKSGYVPQKISTFLKADPKIVEIETTMKKLTGLALQDDLMKEFEKGNRLFAEKRFAEAIKVYQGILDKFPDSYIINLNLGNCHFEQQQYEKAIAAYQKVTVREPTNTRALLSIGNSYSNMNKTEEALAWYKKIDVARIEDPVVLYNIGIFHFNSGDSKGAVEFLKRSTQVQEDFLDGWYQLGMAYLNAGNIDEAVKSFESYLTHDQESERAAQVQEILKAIKK